MDKFKTTKVGKATSVIVGLATAAWLSVGSLAVPMTTYAQTTEETIALLLAQIAQLQAQLTALQGGTTVSTGAKCSFARSLTIGSRGDDVTCLQDYLRSGGYFNRTSTGYFGSITRSAVAAWQAANGVSPAAGYFGSISRAKYDSLVSVVVPPASSAASVGAGASSASSVAVGTGGLTISAAAVQPVNTLAPEGAARLPFTKVTLTAGAQDVTITGITVERTNLANDAIFSGIVLLDEKDMQLGISKTLNSEHKATVGDTVTIKAGQSKTFTVAGNMADDGSTATNALSSYAGQVASLSVIGVVTSATVSGNLPITGAGHTVNSSLAIGSVTNARGSLDPATNPTKSIGTTNYVFSAVKFTAGSAEKIRVKSIRWNQSGSAAASDLANIKTYIDGVAYDTVVSSDGKYYTSTFGDGIVVDKGGSIELYVRGDIVGGSGRTIDFDVYKNTDVHMVGETNKYGITAPNGSADDDSTADESEFLSTNPWYDASQVTVSTGTITVAKASTADTAAANIAENVANQLLGGFTIEAKGEPVSANNLIFNFQITGTGGQVADLTNVSLVDENGVTVAGPADGSGAAAHGTVTFSDTVTFPVGVKTYKLVGKLGTDFANNQTIVASTTPSSNWSNVTGQVTGNTISGSSITSTAITGNTMTVKSAVLTISVSPNPPAQTIVSGAQNFTFANYVLNASDSGEDIRLNSIPLAFETYNNVATNISACYLYDGPTRLNSSTVVDPTAAGSSTAFTFDTSLVVPKQTSKTLELKCNTRTGTSSVSYAWGYDSGASPTVTGVTSGQSASLTENDSTGQTITLTSAGTLTVAANTPKSPSANAVAAGGATGILLGALDFNATNEDIKLNQLGLKLTNTASSSRGNLTGITLVDDTTGATVGTLAFVDSNSATSTLTADFIIPKNSSRTMLVKGGLTDIGVDLNGTEGALISVDYIGVGAAVGKGQASQGSDILAGSSATTFSGVRVFNTFPTVERLTGIDSALAGVTDETVMGFSVKADSSGRMSLYKLTFNVATTGVTADSLNVYAYNTYSNGTFSNPVSGIGAGGKFLNTDKDLEANWASASTDLEIYPQTTAAASTTVEIAAGATMYFKVVATVTGVGSGDSLTVTLKGDAAYPSMATLMGNFSTIETSGANNNNIIWSPRATTTTAALTDLDWINGYHVPTLPSGGITFTKSK